MKVLLVNSEKGMRGGERQTLELAFRLAAKGHEVRLAAREGGRIIAELGDRLPLIGLPFESLPLRTPRLLGLYLKDWKPDIVHTQTSRAHTHCWLAAKFHKNFPPLVVSRRVAFEVTPGISSFLKYRTGVAHYIPISEAAASGLLKRGIPRHMMTIIHSGVDTVKYRDATPDSDLLAAWKGEGKKIIVGSVAAYEREKGLDTLIEAAAAVKGTPAECRFVILGEGKHEGELRRLIRSRGLEKDVLLAKIDRELERMLPCFDIFVLSSLHEGLSTALIAALAAGLPAIASNTGGIPEVLGKDSGLLVEAGEVSDLAGAIQKFALSSSLRDLYAEKARSRAARFDINVTVEKTLAVYQAIERRAGGER
ncbi:MAG: glycosyltransferase family 4 protein [Candidatus Krumholzibacteriota bacterium]|nr:glycosyltransferase family 4 protein [Candidatus Krumholzibacteriota bacterium]